MTFIGGGSIRTIRTEPSGSIEARMRLFGAPTVGVIHEPPELAGMILTRRRKIKGKLTLGQQEALSIHEMQVLDSVYDGIRQAWHIVTYYEDEERTMNTILRAAYELNDLVLGRQSITKLVREMLEPLEHARNTSKKSASGQLEAMQGGRDSRGRKNPQAFAARSIAVQSRLRERLTQVQTLEPRYLSRAEIFLRLIRHAELWLSTTNDFVSKLLAWNGLRPIFDLQRRQDIITHLEFLTQHLKLIDYHPYLTVCQRTAEDLRSAVAILHESQQSAETLKRIRKELGICALSLQIKQQHIAIERIIFKLKFKKLGSRELPISKVRNDIQVIRETLKEIDDSRLKQPVVAWVLRYLAVVFLGPDDLPQLIEALQAASREL